jgi:branched-chain amino acid transport system substrate-binding protein
MHKVFAIAGLVLASALVSMQPASAQEKRPIKVGVLDPYTGPFAAFGQVGKPALEIAFEEAGGQVAGRKIEVVYEDSEGKPDVALAKVRRLVEQQKVDVLLGPVNSAECFAIRDYVAQTNIPWLVHFCTSQELTTKYAAPNLFRVNQGNWQYGEPGGRFAVEKLGYKKGVVVGLDYVAGHAGVKAFNEGYKSSGGEVAELVMIPLGMTDAVPYVSKIRSALQSKKADSVLIPAVWSADGIRLVKTMADYGILQMAPVYTYTATVWDGAFLPAIGNAALGIKTYAVYAWGIDTPENRKFREAFMAKTGKPTDEISYASYIRGRILVEALKAVKGNVEDRAAFVNAIKNVDFAGPAGRFLFDKNHDPVPNLYLTEVKRVDGQLRNVVLQSIVTAGN